MTRRRRPGWRLYIVLAVILGGAVYGLWLVVTGRVDVAPQCPQLQRICQGAIA